MSNLAMATILDGFDEFKELWEKEKLITSNKKLSLMSKAIDDYYHLSPNK